MAKISVIVAVYNVEKLIKRCLDSIINQTMKDLEIILVDDGSTDNSGKICDEYVKLDKRIIVIHKENSGPGSARNTGIDIATGEWIAFVDSDDYIEKDMYKLLYENAIKYKCDISACYFEYINKDNVSLYNSNRKLGIEGKYNEDEFLKLLYKNSETNLICVCVWNKLYRNTVFKELRFKDIIHEDEEILNNIYRHNYSIYVTELPLYKYFQNVNSIVNTAISKRNFIFLDILYNRINIFQQKNPNLYNNALINYCELNITFYNRAEKLKFNYKKYKKDFNSLIFKIIKNKDIKIKTKLRYCLYYVNPQLYSLLLSHRTS